MFCPNCGTQLEDGALFCGSCGAKIAAPAQTAATSSAASAPAAPADRSYPLKSETWIFQL